MCILNVSSLSSFVPASEQNDKRFAITAKVDTVSRTKCDAPFQHAFTDRFHVAEIAFSHSFEDNCDSCGSEMI